ncbi:hypothetical protein [Armatimonas rosea]|uniref:Uncharacterized protein n=1 Tax=Armatimonas rosea TaxID=685828 RepID=A0A7W9SRG1_ARMRO|nr:hypothetical protein [Armatimonas rosea]MBB6051461.1 hypothetical protein [Armatimonas rosea]
MKPLMGPYHDFWVFDEAQRIPQDYWSLLGRKDAPLRIEDDLLLAFAKTLPEFQTDNPSWNPPKQYQGLNWLGPTVVRGSSALLLAEIASRWCETFDTETEPITSLEVPRSLFRSRFETLAELARQGGEPGCYLLHLGI